MAFTHSGLSEAQVDDQIIGALQAVAPKLDIFSRLFPGKGLVKGNSYKVPVLGATTITDKTGGTIATANGSITGAAVEANKFKGVSWEFIEGEMAAELLPGFFAEQMKEAAQSVACAVIDQALAVLTEANFGTGGNNQIVDADFDTDTLIALRNAAKGKLKDMPASFICNSGCASNLLALNQFVSALAVANGKNYFETGKLPSGILGYDAYEYVNMPNNSESLVGAIVGKGAIAVVAGAPEQVITAGKGDVTDRRIITDPVSGLSVQYTEAIGAGGKIVGEVACIFGAAKAQDAAVLLATA